LGKGITNVIVIPAQYKYQMSPFRLISSVPAAPTTVILTYDKSTILCIKLPANILRKTATYDTEIYETLWTIEQTRSNSTTRLLAVSAHSVDDSWCIAKVQHGSNDIEIIQVKSDTSIKQLACIKGPATAEAYDVIGAIVLRRSEENNTVQLVVAYKHDNTVRAYDTVH
jgi:hypothetical protein